MINGETMVVLIVAIVMIAGIIKQRGRVSVGYHRFDGERDRNADIENQRLREEVRELQERIKVLERITVDKENSLANEIESLRDR